jgi:Glucose-6-phosphate dehydrogenase, C-terminal domain
MIFLFTITPVRLGIEEDLVPASSPNPRAASEEAADSVAARGARYGGPSFIIPGYSVFAGQDGVEAAWAVVQPILGNVTPVHIYEPGTWVPSEVQKLTAGISGCPNPVWLPPHGKLL